MNPSRLLPLVLVASLLLALTTASWASLNQDEGWYLLSAQRVEQGYMPFRDFAFTQGPVFPLVYRAALPLVNKWGVYGGRLFTLTLSLTTLLLILCTVRKQLPARTIPFGLLTAAVLLGLNTFHVQYVTIVKTYALAGTLLTGGLTCWLTYATKRKAWMLLPCALLLAAAAGTRLSLGIFLPVCGVALVLNAKDRGHRPWLIFSLSGLAGLLLVFGRFLVFAPEGIAFGLWEYHAAREVARPWLMRAGFISRVVLNYFPAVLLGIAGLVWRPVWRPGHKAIFVGILSVTAVHLFAPFPYDDYQAALYPALVLVLACHAPDRIPLAHHARAGAVFSLAALLFALSSPQIADWVSLGRDRIWWNTKSRSDLSTLREAADHLNALDPEAGLLLTADTYLAIEAGMDVPRGLELGPFSYFPDMPTDRAHRLHVLNRERLQKLMQNTPAPLAAVSGYGFTIRAPDITPVPGNDLADFRKILQKNYRPVSTIDPFGQANTQLRIYRKQ